MDIGKLNKLVTFRVNNPEQLGAGKKDVYSDLLTTRGNMRQRSGRRSLEFGELNQNRSWELTVRFQTELEQNLAQSVKVVYEGRTFTVDSWEKVGEKRFYYKIQLNEEVE